MVKVKYFFRLMRVNHYVKNIIVFFGLLFSGLFFSFKFFEVFFVFFLFSIGSSIVYVFNDIKDVDKDKLHPKKKFRPLPSGVLSLKDAFFLEAILVFVFFVLSFILFFYFNNFKAFFIVLFYIFFNYLYTVFFKHMVLLDVFSIAFSFFLRLLAGTFGVNIFLSEWLFLSVFFGSLFFSFDKRRVELLSSGSSHRSSLKKYNVDFLNFSVFFSVILTIVFYSLYVLLKHSENIFFILSIVFLVIVILKYLYLSFVVKNTSDFFENVVFDKELLFYIFVVFVLVFLGVYL